MKQKLILLLVLIASLAACTKDDGDDYISENNPAAYNNASDSFSQFGEFEGRWLYAYGADAMGYKLTVTEKNVQVAFPENELLIFIDSNLWRFPEYQKLDIIGRRPIEQQPITHTFHYEKVGISDYLLYYNFYYDDLPQYSEKGEGYVVINGKLDVLRNDYSRSTLNFGILSDKPGVLIYNMRSHFWILTLKITKIYIEDGEEKLILDLQSVYKDESSFDHSYLDLIFQSYNN